MIYIIWRIKILQDVGYSLSEIRELTENPDANFYKSISDNVDDLEKKRDGNSNFIEFSKSVKLTGRIPTSKEIGNMSYSNLIELKVESYLEAMESL